MFAFLHLGHQVGPAQDGGPGEAAGQDDLDVRGAPVEERQDVLFLEEVQIDGDIDLVEDDDPVAPGKHGPETASQPFPGPVDILPVGISVGAQEAFAAELSDREMGRDGGPP